MDGRERTANVLLLTSTIRPNVDQPQLKLVDPQERLDDYSRALGHYAMLLDAGVVDRIVYADNSGFDLSGLRARYASSRIDWVSFYDLDYDPSYHRGYGEFRLVDRAWRESPVLARLHANDRVWKVTGRYIIENLRAVIAMTPRKFDLCCEVRGVWAEMGFMAWSPHGYALHIEGLWHHFATGKVPELILAERLREVDPAASHIVRSWYWPPVVTGRRGTDGSSYKGRFTSVRFLAAAALKLVQWPIRRISAELA